jgi:hypothetical protein
LKLDVHRLKDGRSVVLLEDLMALDPLLVVKDVKTIKAEDADLVFECKGHIIVGERKKGFRYLTGETTRVPANWLVRNVNIIRLKEIFK